MAGSGREGSIIERIVVSIIIKAFNEQDRIAATVESALRAVAVTGGEVILSDSLSTDATVAIASRYPISIVCMNQPRDRSCGAGAQLGYQYARGDYLYILDGDMEMQPDFLPAAIALMERDPTIAGVGGMVEERVMVSVDYQARQRDLRPDRRPGNVSRLNMGGLYRRSAIREVGYLTNRNLHAFEEYELAVRLRARGYRLQRIDVPAIHHFGHAMTTLPLLFSRWRSRYLCGIGELLRASAGQPQASLVWRELVELRRYAVVGAWWLVLALVWLAPLTLVVCSNLFALLLFLPLGLLCCRKGTVEAALFAFMHWNLSAAATVRGVLGPQCPPQELIDATIVKEAGGALRPRVRIADPRRRGRVSARVARILSVDDGRGAQQMRRGRSDFGTQLAPP
jgi:glycosyltransferase involved in cell wall biosynthesis